ncbi:hypothetical protein SAMN05660297_02767 [Natronincola peptidivorans]|uniref:Uncharacterized protein n=1 Tax=Natronincola peptidivorans TaxID=426128 RepID=A0A1I0FFB5_9FIRM|nr:hypothetical protein [Natronincola peptidivorans]SET56070.1 hypothetical protein SAMN05660297_02767 [Natronincola peptidivorans]
MKDRFKLVEVNFAYGENIDLFFIDSKTGTWYLAYVSNAGILHDIVDYTNGLAGKGINPEIKTTIRLKIKSISLEDIKNRKIEGVYYRDC